MKDDLEKSLEKLDKSWDNYLEARKKTNEALDKMIKASEEFVFVCKMICALGVGLCFGTLIVWMIWHI